MLKKYLIILLLCGAYALNLAHSIIPHHHNHESGHTSHVHEHHHGTSEKHSHHDSNEGQSDDDLNNLFSYFTHSSIDDITGVKHSISLKVVKQLIVSAALLPENFSFNSFYIPSILIKPPPKENGYTGFHFFSEGLRAPPTFI